MRRRTLLGWGLALFGGASATKAASTASASGFSFPGIDGAPIALADFAGKPVLVVNTASRCGFVGQYDGLQALHDTYRGRGLTVIGVPSNSFYQELGNEGAVKDFCEVNFAINFPMTEITDVTGRRAHPFYAWAREQGAAPRWNFHKILLDGDGRLKASYGATTPPDSPKLVSEIERLLPTG